MPNSRLYPRLLQPRLIEALEDSPVVLIHGPRQCGKTTLAQMTCTPRYPALRPPGDNRNYGYITFDDPVARESARSDPMGFVAGVPEHVILDEVQQVPDLFEVIKFHVDRERVAGRFLLTGSTNLLLLPRLSESLTGRLRIVRLHPLAQRELEAGSPPGSADSEFLAALFGDGFPVFRADRLGRRLFEAVVNGGYPPALARPTAVRRANWYRDYVDTLIQGDVRSIGRIRSLDVLPALLRAAASQTARLHNLSGLASAFELCRPSIGRYVTLLERLFLIERLAAWHSSRLRRLVKSPKLHLTDSGLAAGLLGTSADMLERDRTLFGQLLETFVLQELRRQASWHDVPYGFFHFRDKDGAEVDIVLEHLSGTVAGVEVKASATVRSSDFRGLRKLKNALGRRFMRGVVLYDGEAALPFGERLHALPISRLWKTP